MNSYNIDLIKFETKQQTGHVVYNALYPYSAGLPSKPKKIIYKENKSRNAHYSSLEVAFSSLASRFLAPKLTPSQALVKNKKGEVFGLASEHFCYTAAEREGLIPFYSVAMDRNNSQEPLKFEKKEVNEATEIPIYFFNQFSSGFFYFLLEAHKSKKLVLDMSSLASVLTTAYSLEEDDLHKGNFGFYVVEKAGQKHVVFFKIDNDLMMADSLMSRYGSRIVSWRFGNRAFAVTRRDLETFPKILDSQNHYWPTTSLLIVNPLDPKVYSSAAEISAFVELGKLPEFKKAKWREFYKHILIPASVLEDSLIQGSCEPHKAMNRAQLALVLNAAVARQARLRAVLFTIPEFRKFVANFSEAEQVALQDEIFNGLDKQRHNLALQEVVGTMQLCRSLCQTKKFDEKDERLDQKDTPLHVAIRLGDFRYYETWQSLHRFIDQKNSRGETALDLALAAIKRTVPQSTDDPDPRRDPYMIAQFLLKQGAQRTSSYQELDREEKRKIKNYTFPSLYLKRVVKLSSRDELFNLIRDLGEDYRYSLKMKKELTVLCLRRFIEQQRNNPELNSILLSVKKGINGSKTEKPAPELQFIRQLRSRLWIIRAIRGLFGRSSTQVELNDLIDKELKRLNVHQPSVHSFFPANVEPKKRDCSSSYQNSHEHCVPNEVKP